MTSTTHNNLEGHSANGPGNGEIAALAYQLWKDRGCPIGSLDEDWFLAEAELIGQERVAAVAA